MLGGKTTNENYGEKGLTAPRHGTVLPRLTPSPPHRSSRARCSREKQRNHACEAQAAASGPGHVGARADEASHPRGVPRPAPRGPAASRAALTGCRAALSPLRTASSPAVTPATAATGSREATRPIAQGEAGAEHPGRESGRPQKRSAAEVRVPLSPSV